eukprot:scaffold63_cov306-Pinguiococcus_pyrenoidosus.AAC.16
MWRGLLLSVLLLNAADLARAEVPCSLPPDEQLKDKCFMAPGTVAGGGMGARMLSMLNFFTIAVDTGSLPKRAICTAIPFCQQRPSGKPTLA